METGVGEIEGEIEAVGSELGTFVGLAVVGAGVGEIEGEGEAVRLNGKCENQGAGDEGDGDEMVMRVR